MLYTVELCKRFSLHFSYYSIFFCPADVSCYRSERIRQDAAVKFEDVNSYYINSFPTCKLVTCVAIKRRDGEEKREKETKLVLVRCVRVSFLLRNIHVLSRLLLLTSHSARFVFFFYFSLPRKKQLHSNERARNGGDDRYSGRFSFRIFSLLSVDSQMLLSPSFLYVAHLFQLIPVALASDKNDVVLGQHNNNTAEIQL